MLGVIGVVVLYSVVVEKTERGPMSAKIAVTHTDHTAESLRKLALSHKHRECRSRLRALALMIEDSLSRAEIGRRVGVDVETLRDGVVRYDAAGVEGLRDAARSGRPPKLDRCQEAQARGLDGCRRAVVLDGWRHPALDQGPL